MQIAYLLDNYTLLNQFTENIKNFYHFTGYFI